MDGWIFECFGILCKALLTSYFSGLVRPAPPVNLTSSTNDAQSCNLTWSVVENLQGDFETMDGLVSEIAIAKMSRTGDTFGVKSVAADEKLEWKVIAADVETQYYHLTDLDAYSNYSVRVRTRPKRNGFWSAYSNVSCTTNATWPGGSLGIVPGAYEEVGNGGQRRVRVTSRSIDWLIGCLDGPLDGLIDWMVDWLLDWLIDWLFSFPFGTDNFSWYFF